MYGKNHYNIVKISLQWIKINGKSIYIKKEMLKGSRKWDGVFQETTAYVYLSTQDVLESTKDFSSII